MKKEGEKNNKKQYQAVYFPGAVLLLYLIVFFFNPENVIKALKTSLNMFIHVLPALVSIVVLMGLVNHFVKPKTMSKYVGKGSGVKGWLLAIATGILSHGPIYAWYPLLNRLRDHGMKNSLIAVFLYNRGIKIPLLPIMIHYFGVTYVVIFAIYLTAASLVQGLVFELIEE